MTTLGCSVNTSHLTGVQCSNYKLLGNTLPTRGRKRTCDSGCRVHYWSFWMTVTKAVHGPGSIELLRKIGGRALAKPLKNWA